MTELPEISRIVARGHPAIRGTHGKTLELTAEPAITGRATCVVGVAAQLPVHPVAGPLRLTLTAGGESVSWRATGNSAWWPASGSAVIRRSGQRLPDTFATDSELAADDLPRSLLDVLATPHTTVTLQAEPTGGSATLVCCRLTGVAPARLLAEASAADLVLAEDPAARSWLTSTLTSALGPAGVAALPWSTISAAAAGLAAGGRVLAVAANESTDLTELLRIAGSVEVLGLPAELAVSAVAPGHSPTLQAERLRWRELPVLAAAHPALALAFRCPAERLPRLLAELDRDRADIVLAPVSEPERPVRGRVADVVSPGEDSAGFALPDRGELACWVAGLASVADGPAIEPAALVRELLAQSVTPRTIALAVAALPGWSRRSAYEFVLTLSEESSR